MAKRVTLASTFTAKYYPSQNLTDAFYLDGRLRSIREERTADISFDREDRGFFLSLFTSAENPELKGGQYPSYEPKLSKFCTDVKYSGKKIDDMTRSFRELAVDITGRMMLQENEARNSYFSGLMVKDGEGFALTVGGGLAFLYRDDALYPLTDAGIPMEPIDAHGNNVADFNNYFCSKSAHVLWSNFFKLNIDDCIILCNKELYSALGQRELLRILDDANDQCDAAGTIITQAAARKPNVPMQITISFVLDVKGDDKKSFFKRHKKDDEETEGLYVKSDFESGTLGQAAKASANAGFAAGYAVAAESADAVNERKDAVIEQATSEVKNTVVNNTKILFGDDKNGGSEEPNENSDLQFFGEEKNAEPIVELSAEEMMKRLFSDARPTAEETASEVNLEKVTPIGGETIDTSAGINPFELSDDSDVKEMKIVSSSEFTPEEDNSSTKSIESLSKFAEEKRNEENPAISLNASGILASSLREQNITSSVVAMVNEPDKEDKKDTAAEDEDKKVTESAATVIGAAKEVTKAAVIGGSAIEEGNNILFTAGSVVGAGSSPNVNPTAEFNPYSVGGNVNSNEEIPFVFGDDSVDILKKPEPTPVQAVQSANKPEIKAEETKEELKEVTEEIKASVEEDFKNTDIVDEKVISDADTLVEEAVDSSAAKEDNRGFLEVAKDAEEILEAPEFTFSDESVHDEEPEQNIDFPETKAEQKSNVVEANVVLPFESPVESVAEVITPKVEDIPNMPNFDGDTFDSPAFVPNTETPVGTTDNQNYAVGSYDQRETDEDSFVNPVANVQSNYGQPYGSEPINTSDYNEDYINGMNQQNYGAESSQFYGMGGQSNEFGGANMDYNNEFNQMSGDNTAEQPNGYGMEPPFDMEQQFNGSQSVSDNQFYSNFDEAASNYDGYSNQNNAPYSNNDGMNDDEIARILGMGDFEDSFDGVNVNEPPQQVARPVQRKTGKINPNGTNATKKPSASGTKGKVKRKEPTYFGLTKAGWIFIAAVLLILACLIGMIALGVSKCNDKKEKKAKETEETQPTYEIVADPTTVETEPEVKDPSAPIGAFYFSEYTGFRTWRDVFSLVYNEQIEDTADPRIAKIIAYNNLNSDYKPSAGDMIYLPPAGVLDDSIQVTFFINGPAAKANETDVTGGEVVGDIGLNDGTDATSAENAAETTAETTAEA